MLLGQLVELGEIRVTNVVHEHVNPADIGLRAADQLRGSGRVTEIHGHMQRLTHTRAFRAARAGDDLRALVDQQPGGLAPDSGSRGGYDADAVAQSQIHGSLP